MTFYSISVAQQACFGACLGLLSHHGIFIHHEHHLGAARTFRFYILLSILVYGTETRWLAGPFGNVQLAAFTVISAYATALLGSMFIYRVLFHPLRAFPGPFMAKVSKIWNVVKASKSTNYKLMEDMHQEYGDFVRTGMRRTLHDFNSAHLRIADTPTLQGPNEISVFKPEAVRALDGVGTKCTKSAWYDIMQPRVSLATTRDRALHQERRRIWERAFNSSCESREKLLGAFANLYSALRDYERRVKYFAEQLQGTVRQSKNCTTNVSKLFYLYSFDVMSDLAFGEPLNMLTSDENHFTVRLLQDGMDLLGPLSPVPWLVRIGYSIPGVAQHFKSLLAWSAKKLQHRVQVCRLFASIQQRLIVRLERADKTRCN